MRHAVRTWWRVLGALTVVVVLAASCGGDDDSDDASDDPTPAPTTAPDGDEEPETDDGTPVYGGSITVGLEAETNNWLPGVGSFANSGTTVAVSIYDPLVVLNGNGEFEPGVAESLEPNDDLTEWTITLRPGVQFHDGSDLTAEVIKFNYDNVWNAEGALTAATLATAGVTDVRVEGDLVVVYELSGPNAAFPDVLRGAAGWPVSQQAFEDVGPDRLGEAPVGTGPFEFVEWTRDDRFVVRRNENYWRTDADGNDLPYLDEVIFRPISDEDSRAQSLRSDSAQVVSTLRGGTIKQIQGFEDEGFDSNLYVGNTSSASIFNVLVPPVDDLRIRQALAYAGDADAVARVLGDDGLVPATTTFFSPDSPWFSDAASDAYPGAAGRDLDRAIELVEEYRADPDRSDGRAPGSPIEITYACPPDPSLLEVSQLQQSVWGEAGVEVNLTQVEQATHIANAVGSADQDPPWSGEYMVNCWREGAGGGDPLTAFQSFFGDPATTPGNFTNFFDPEIADLIVQLRESPAFEDRYAAAERINIISNENVPLAWGVGTASMVAWRDDIRGLTNWVTPNGSPGTGTPEGFVNVNQAWLTGG
ncbi:MAG: ABC transporter substrate-binding protein [Acidimicrobiales bacterium]